MNFVAIHELWMDQAKS